jgi:hypothetical protein
MEPLRGLHILARALPRLLAEVPDGPGAGDRQAEARAYGGDAPGGGTWTDACFAGVDYDPARVHFLGKVEPRADAGGAAARARARLLHLPLRALVVAGRGDGRGCYVIARTPGRCTTPSRTASNGRLLPFFDVDALSAAMIAACRTPRPRAPAGRGARDGGGRFSRAKGREAWLTLLRDLGAEIPR